MLTRKVTNRVSWVGAVDWDRRLFDALIPLPDGTSYNSYLIEGSEKVVLIDTVDPEMSEELVKKLEGVERIDYIVANHGEQDHSGCIPLIMAMYPEAVLLTSLKGREILSSHLGIAEEHIRVVEDGEEISLGDRTLKFFYTPWVHWPETMVTYLVEDKILFSCDMFGSHLATSELIVPASKFDFAAAKRYFAEIMMPFSSFILKHLEKLSTIDIDYICPSHGQIHSEPEAIMEVYRKWSSETKNYVAIPYVSMHDSTREMVTCLVEELSSLGIEAEQFDLTSVDLGKLAMALVDATTLVVATPTVLGGPHPLAVYATYLANTLRAKFKYATVIGSFGWGGKTADVISGMLQTVKPEILEPIIIKGLPDDEVFARIKQLAKTISDKHLELKVQ